MAQLERSDEMEIVLRQVASVVYVRQTGDREAGDRLKGLVTLGDNIAPPWLIDEARGYSQQIHKQRAWLKAAAKGNTATMGQKGDGKGQGKGKGKGKKGAQGAPDTQA